MSNKVKDVDIKSRTLFNDIINIFFLIEVHSMQG